MGKYLVNSVNLGKRVVGYEIYNSETKEIIGLMEKQIKDMLRKGNTVYGFIIDKNDELQLDKVGFHTSNIMIKTGINHLKSLELKNGTASVFYTLLAVYKDKNGAAYEVISSRLGRTRISESKLRALLEVSCLTVGCNLKKMETSISVMV